MSPRMTHRPVFTILFGVACGCAGPSGSDTPPGPDAEPEPVPRVAPPSALDARAVRAAHIAARQAAAAADRRFHVVADGDALRTGRQRGLDARFDERGVALSTDQGLDGRLDTAAVRCGGQALAAPRGGLVVDPAKANRVVRAGAGIREWYVSGPLGLEHGFELDGGCATTLTVDVVTPGFVPTAIGDDLRLAGEDGVLALRYAHLFAHDADGQPLPAHFVPRDHAFTIEVDARAARGAVTIDPLVYVELQRVGPPPDADSPAGDAFGAAVSMSGATAIVGAPGDDVGGNGDQGSAYIYERSGYQWTLSTRLVAADGAAGDAFGADVAVQGDTVVVGAPAGDVGANVDQGSAYVFVRGPGGWAPQGRLIASDGAAGDRFGTAVALAGNAALVGAPLDDVGGRVDQGSAYVFERSGAQWTQRFQFAPPDSSAGDQLGAAVALSPDTALLGSPTDDVFNVDQGSAVVFIRSGGLWAQQARLFASDPSAGDQLGSAVALFENTALVGAPLDDGAAVDQGSAYVFTRSASSWQQRQRLVAGDAAAGDRFGGRVTLVTDVALIGSAVDDIATNVDQGSAYVFVRGANGFVPDVKLVARDGAAGDHFGQSVVAISQIGQVYYTAVGAPLADGPQGATDVGAVYFGHLEPPGACSGQPAGTVCRLANGPCDVAERCDGVSSLCPPDELATAGTACGDATETVCDRPDTCDGAGACQANLADVTTICRPDAGDCDVAETCDGNGACPADTFEPAGAACGDGGDTTCDDPDTCNGAGLCLPNHAPSTTVCRADAGECDVAETCDGNGACPADAFEPVGTLCGDGSETTCDHADRCDAAGACEPNFAPTTTTCRAATGDCDVAETCDGAGACPADAFAPAGTACGDGSESTCDHADSCNAAGGCEPNFAPPTTTCRAASGECDVAEACDGAGACPADAFALAGTACGDGSESTCDHADRCNAVGGCEANFAPPTTICRDADGACDVAETCDGAGACPADGFAPAGTACDPAGETCAASAEACTGASSSCPADDPAPCTPVPSIEFTSHPTPVIVDDCAPVVEVPAGQRPLAVDGAGAPVPVTCEPISGPGLHLLQCTAADGHGNVATTTIAAIVLPSLRVAFQAPLADDNRRNDPFSDADVVNKFKAGSTVPHRIKLYTCSGVDVTFISPLLVTVWLDVTERNQLTNALVVDVPEEFTGLGGPGGLMVPIGDNYFYNLKTRGYETGTTNNARYFQSMVTVTYDLFPTLVAGREDAALESK